MEVAHETAFGRLLPFRSGTKGGIKAAGRLSHIAEQCVAGRRLQANAERRPSPGRPDGTAIWLGEARLHRFFGFGDHKVPGN